MKNQSIFIVIHGPYKDNAYKEIFKSLYSVRDSISRIILVTYLSCREDTEKSIKEYGRDLNISSYFIKDLINPGYFNLNRQIITVQEGLNHVQDKGFVIKLRNDQWCDMHKLLKCLNREYFCGKESHRVLSTNCFTRIDRYYHPSDMFLCGWKSDLVDYYSLPLQQSTHMDIQLSLMKSVKYSYEPFKNYLVSPESELFKHYLALKNWDFQYTEQDSYNSIKKYIYLINTWDINLRWNKQRNAFLPAKTIILPYSFTMAPFAGAPEEQAKCYARHSFEGHETLRDRWFIFYSRLVFSVKYNKIHRILVKIKNHTPKPVRKLMLKTGLGRFFKSVT